MARSHRRRASVTRRGKTVVTLATVTLVVGGTFAYFTMFPEQAPAFVQRTLATVGLADAEPPTPTCPLTGEEVGAVPRRPALAIKIENAPEARPQAALNDADVVVEQPVEGGYTRFIAIFHCSEADRVGPVRSARSTDPNYLRQLGRTIFGYAGGVPSVGREVTRAGLTDENYEIAVDAYVRDTTKVAPHDLYTSTASLWRAGRAARTAPAPLFAYASWDARAKRIGSARLPYSSVADVRWTWSRRADAWVRAHGSAAHVLEDGSPVVATNVVIQMVDVFDSDILDAAGNPSPEVTLTGRGRAFVLLDGRMVVARWERETLDDVTTYRTKDGTEVTLRPGTTWVELVPSTIAVDLAR
ncbi:MAG TPA: DUF3048 domain-containing protein [Actinomycetota bacterium]|nr:DUF3048 domain-containing protein [Actinomycetota bacterium]